MLPTNVYEQMQKGSGINLLSYLLDRFDYYTNLNRPDKPGYNPFLNTGTVPTPGINAKGMIRAAKEASKLSGKNFTPFMRNALGKRSSTLGAITANDIDESKVVVGQGVQKATQPFEHNPYSPSNINRAANYYVKENNLETFMGPNGKMYVKTNDGKVRSFESVGREYIDNSGYGW